MPKSDKELAVELVSAYLSGWYSAENSTGCLGSKELEKLLDMAYRAIRNLDR